MSVEYEFESDINIGEIASLVARIISVEREGFIRPLNWELACAKDHVWFCPGGGDRIVFRNDGTVRLGGSVSAAVLDAVSQSLGIAVNCIDGTYPKGEIGG